MPPKGGRECYHCKAWIEEGEAHDCWTTTEAALTADLSEDLREAWERFREAAVEFGEQRVYASLNSIMFARKVCYCFVRPKKSYLEVCIFLGRTVSSPRVRRVLPSSKTKFAHLIRVTHRDEVEPPLTDWMREAYDTSEALSARSRARPVASKGAASAPRKKSRPRKKPLATKTSPTQKSTPLRTKTRRRAG